MKGAFDFPGEESTFIIIDKKGIVRYIWSGKVPASEFAKIKEILKKFSIEE